MLVNGAEFYVVPWLQIEGKFIQGIQKQKTASFVWFSVAFIFLSSLTLNTDILLKKLRMYCMDSGALVTACEIVPVCLPATG